MASVARWPDHNVKSKAKHHLRLGQCLFALGLHFLCTWFAFHEGVTHAMQAKQFSGATSGRISKTRHLLRRRLRRSALTKYGGERSQAESPSKLLPYECLVFGPTAWQMLES